MYVCIVHVGVFVDICVVCVCVCLCVYVCACGCMHVCTCLTDVHLAVFCIALLCMLSSFIPRGESHVVGT